MRKPRVAVCLCGQYNSWEDVRANVFGQFRTIKPDYFFATWDKAYNSDGNFTEIEHDRVVSSFAGHQLIKAEVVPYALLPEGYRESAGVDEVTESSDLSLPLGVGFESWQLSNMWHHVNYLKREYEFENDFRYDIVVLMRNDLVFNSVDLSCKFFNKDILKEFSNPFNVGMTETSSRAMSNHGHFGLTLPDWIYVSSSQIIDIIASFRDYLLHEVDSDNMPPNCHNNTLVHYFDDRHLRIDATMAALQRMEVVHRDYDGSLRRVTNDVLEDVSAHRTMMEDKDQY